MGDMVAIDDVVIPVSLTLLKCSALESESAFEATGFGRGLFLSEGELTCIVVPGAEQVNGLDGGRNAERER